jgi:hypothetical protein
MTKRKDSLYRMQVQQKTDIQKNRSQGSILRDESRIGLFSVELTRRSSKTSRGLCAANIPDQTTWLACAQVLMQLYRQRTTKFCRLIVAVDRDRACLRMQRPDTFCVILKRSRILKVVRVANETCRITIVGGGLEDAAYVVPCRDPSY